MADEQAGNPPSNRPSNTIDLTGRVDVIGILQVGASAANATVLEPPPAKDKGRHEI
jgi:hypothetical protein